MFAAELDSQWFFSSASQCAAALVALIAAILWPRIMEHLARLRRQHHNMKINFQSFCTSLGDTKANLTPRVRSEGQQDAKQPILAGALSVLDLQKGWISVAKIAAWASEIRNAEKGLGAEHEANGLKPSLRGRAEDLDNLGKTLKEYWKEVIPVSSGMIFVLLAYLTIVGIALPLWELAEPHKESATIPLFRWFAFGLVGLAALFLYQGWEILRLRWFRWPK